MTTEELLGGRSAGDLVSTTIGPAEYVLQIVSIRRGEMIMSFSTDTLRLQEIARESYKTANKRTQQLVKCRAAKHLLEQKIEELTKGL